MDWYPWVKALHIISVIAWMAGMLYLPRLFVYHASATPGSEQSETFKVMERRLLKAIMTPAMTATWVFGLIMLVSVERVDITQDVWMQVKLAIVVAMSALHTACARLAEAFAADRNTRSPRFYRFFNEVPTLGLIAVVLLAVVKPF